MLNARTWHWLIVSAYLMFPVTLVAWILPEGSPFIWLANLALVWVCIVCGMGGILGIMMACGKLHMGCPDCNSRSFVMGGNREGIHLDCPKCGELRVKAGRVLGLQVVKPDEEEEHEEESQDDQPDHDSPFLAPKRHKISFAIIYLPVVASITAASIIHWFNPAYLLFPGFICYVLGGLLLNALFSGFIRGKRRDATRAKTPIRYWSTIIVMCLAYAFATYFPLGYALQERNKEKAAAEHGQDEKESKPAEKRR